MADLVSHGLTGWILGVRRLDRPSLGWLVAGTLLPDLASRLPRLALHFGVEGGLVASSGTTLRLIEGLEFPHTPAGLVLVVGLVAVALPELLVLPLSRRRVAAMLGAGGALHLALDLLQLHLAPAYPLAYPFTIDRWELGWVSTEASLIALPLLVAAAWAVTPRTQRGGRPEG